MACLLDKLNMQLDGFLSKVRIDSDLNKLKLGGPHMIAPQTPKSHMDLLVFRLGILAKSLSEFSISILAPASRSQSKIQSDCPAFPLLIQVSTTAKAPSCAVY